MSLFVTLQKLLPQHLLSRTAGAFAASELRAVSQPLIRAFAKTYSVDMAEAERPHFSDYTSFNDFFTRSLKSEARPIEPSKTTLVCPADGAVSQLGTIENGELLQAKGIRYSFEALAGSCAAPEFEGGQFLTVYLSPKDYHRVHVPTAGRLTRSIAIPGKLFSVNGKTEAEIKGLFAVNERLVCEYETEFGKMLVIMVGALIVASIETVFESPKSPYRKTQIQSHDLILDKGAEMGRFLLGSTVIVAFEKDRVQLDTTFTPGTAVRMGQAVGEIR
jgi:phosphatidylserine decarboxylase